MQRAVLLLQQLRLHRPRSAGQTFKPHHFGRRQLRWRRQLQLRSPSSAQLAESSRRGHAGAATTAAARVRPCAPIVGGVASSNPWPNSFLISLCRRTRFVRNSTRVFARVRRPWPHAWHATADTADTQGTRPYFVFCRDTVRASLPVPVHRTLAPPNSAPIPCASSAPHVHSHAAAPPSHCTRDASKHLRTNRAHLKPWHGALPLSHIACSGPGHADGHAQHHAPLQAAAPLPPLRPRRRLHPPSPCRKDHPPPRLIFASSAAGRRRQRRAARRDAPA